MRDAFCIGGIQKEIKQKRKEGENEYEAKQEQAEVYHPANSPIDFKKIFPAMPSVGVVIDLNGCINQQQNREATQKVDPLVIITSYVKQKMIQQGVGNYIGKRSSIAESIFYNLRFKCVEVDPLHAVGLKN